MRFKSETLNRQRDLLKIQALLLLKNEKTKIPAVVCFVVFFNLVMLYFSDMLISAYAGFSILIFFVLKLKNSAVQVGDIEPTKNPPWAEWKISGLATLLIASPPRADRKDRNLYKLNLISCSLLSRSLAPSQYSTDLVNSVLVILSANKT